MKTSVVISTYNRRETFIRLLKNLAEQTTLPDEIIIIEAGDHLFKKSEVPCNLNLKLILSPKVSLAKARALGQHIAVGDIIFFFDDDIIVPSNYIAEAISYFKKNKDVMAVGGTYADDTTINRAKWSIFLGRLLYIYSDGKRNKLLKSGWADYVRGVYAEKITKADWLFGCNFAVQAKAFSEVHFQEQMLAWSFLEDVFFGSCVQKIFPNSMRILPSLSVVHKPLASGGEINKITLRMRILYRFIFWRDHMATTKKFTAPFFLLGMVANLLLMLKQEKKIWIIYESFCTFLFVLRHKKMDWDLANDFISS